MTLPVDWIVPQWPAPANVRAVCSTRSDGRSRPPYDSLNLGDHVGDRPDAVASNRALFAAAIQARPVFLQQVHGLQAVQLTADTPDGTQADGCVATQLGVACTIMVADCLPVLFTTVDGRAVAAAHAGWRGLAGENGRDVLACVWDRFRDLARLDAPAQTLAWLGPCIGPEAFEVGPEVKAAFEAGDPPAAALFKSHGPDKWLADLPGLARRRLHAAGVAQVELSGCCTYGEPERFFSYRRKPDSGRMATVAWLTGD